MRRVNSSALRPPRLAGPIRHVPACVLTLLLSVLAPATSTGAQITATEIAVRFHDPAGKLTHKLTAKRGTLKDAVQQLQDVSVIYFSAKDPNLIVQRLDADEATWNEKTEVLAGRGRVRVVTEQNRLEGDGFDFAFATSLLHIHRNFSMANSELRLTSDRGTAELVVERAGNEVKLRDVKRCEAVGNLVIAVQPTAKRSYLFDRAFSERAIYDGQTQMITLPQPVRYQKQGRPAGEARGGVEIKLKP